VIVLELDDMFVLIATHTQVVVGRPFVLTCFIVGVVVDISNHSSESINQFTCN
jgi:hypothetical protein